MRSGHTGHGQRRRTVTSALPRAPRHRRTLQSSTIRKIASVLAGMTFAGGVAYGATNWVVSLNGGSSAEGQGATVQNLTIASVATPLPANELYPGGLGDVVVTITNPNPYPVTLTGVDLPTSTTYAAGYTSSGLSGAISGCAATTSDVSWNFATSTSGSAHALTTPVVIGPSGNANNPLTITFTNDASMSALAPAACEGAFFSMPSFTGIAASGGSATVTPTPTVDGWTS